MAYANGRQPGAVSVILVLSYLWDWIIIAFVVVTGTTRHIIF